MRSINRRSFLKSSSGLLALAAMDLSQFNCAGINSSPRISRSPRGANERINVAIIGLGGRSSSHLNAYNTQNNCVITHVCDPDTAKAPVALDRARKSNGDVDAQFVQDLRRVFDDQRVHAVSIAAPNHWHSLAAVWAMQAGKDVYVEKPVSHTLKEGRSVVNCAQRTGAVCQVGTQMRSNAALVDAMAYLHEGNLGKVLVSRALCYKPRASIGKVDGPQKPPETVDYDLWCGPAPLAPLMRAKLHYDWHWVWDTGDGDIGNQGIHEIDIARWALNSKQMPLSVQCVGGRFGYVDDGQTPNTQIADFDYGPGQPRLIVEVRGLETKPYHSKGVENVVECEKGFLVSPSYTSAVAYDRDGNILRRFDGGNELNHFNNFVDVVRSRKVTDLHSPAIEGHLSCVLQHMANISYRTGQRVPFELAGDAFGNATADQTMAQMRKHLAENKVVLEDAWLTLGRKLRFNPSSESFSNDSQANQMLTRDYRKPFVMPA